MSLRSGIPEPSEVRHGWSQSRSQSKLQIAFWRKVAKNKTVIIWSHNAVETDVQKLII
jgi:hypothetical protein